MQTQPIVLDPAETQGVWEGWGTSLCWMGKAFGDRQDVADLLFTTKQVSIGGEELPGLGLNIVRYNAGACSWNSVDGRRMAASKNISPTRQMEGFWLDPHQPDPDSTGWNWSVDANQRQMLIEAKRRGANRFELFSNSPMWWMCANDNPSGAAKATDDNLRPDEVEAFATYLAEVAKRAKERWGIRFDTVEPFNEPLSSWWHAGNNQEGCHFSVDAQCAVLPRLRRALDRAGLRGTKIAASDETYVSQAIEAWQGYDAACRALVSHVNVHGYQGDTAPRAELRAAVGAKPIWMSEHGEGDPLGIELMRALLLDMRGLKPTAWCYWQPLDGGGWGAVSASPSPPRVEHVNPKYFVLAQFTRHIRPGWTILAAGGSDALAACDARHRRLAIVAVNLGSTDVRRAFDVSRFGALRTTARAWITEPRGAARCAPLPEIPVLDGTVSVTLPPQSVVTLELGR